MGLFDYIDAHPVFTFLLGIYGLILMCVLIIVTAQVFNLIRFLVNRPLRHLSIMVRGYPPEHCDADGDPRPVANVEGKQPC